MEFSKALIDLSLNSLILAILNEMI